MHPNTTSGHDKSGRLLGMPPILPPKHTNLRDSRRQMATKRMSRNPEFQDSATSDELYQNVILVEMGESRTPCALSHAVSWHLSRPNSCGLASPPVSRDLRLSLQVGISVGISSTAHPTAGDLLRDAVACPVVEETIGGSGAARCVLPAIQPPLVVLAEHRTYWGVRAGRRAISGAAGGSECDKVPAWLHDSPSLR